MTDSREWMRFAKDASKVQLKWGAGLSRDGLVVDESFGGIAVHVSDDSGLSDGLTVDVHYKVAPMAAVVRNVRANADGLFRVGLEWVRPD